MPDTGDGYKGLVCLLSSSENPVSSFLETSTDDNSHRKSRGLKTSFAFGSLPCFLSTSLLIHPEVLAEVGKLLKLDF